jgi:hypothetical protein
MIDESTAQPFGLPKARVAAGSGSRALSLTSQEQSRSASALCAEIGFSTITCKPCCKAAMPRLVC